MYLEFVFIYLELKEVVCCVVLVGYKLEVLNVIGLGFFDWCLGFVFYSEKLVIVYGLMRIFVGIVFRIIKNFRVCRDCYLFIKCVLKVFSRDIIVRDRVWFYYFVGGFCFCNDYW